MIPSALFAIIVAFTIVSADDTEIDVCSSDSNLISLNGFKTWKLIGNCNSQNDQWLLKITITSASKRCRITDVWSGTMSYVPPLAIAGPSWKRDLNIDDEDICFLLKSEIISMSDLMEIFPSGCAGTYIITSNNIFPITLTSQSSTHFVIEISHLYDQTTTTNAAQTKETLAQTDEATTMQSYAYQDDVDDPIGLWDFEFDVISLIIGFSAPSIILILTIWKMLRYRKQLMRMRRHTASSAYKNNCESNTTATAQYQMAQSSTIAVNETSGGDLYLTPINAGGNMVCEDTCYEAVDVNGAIDNEYEIYSN
ncbi:uncharacterized protein LOC144431297 isoform X2 [Styela clava]